MAGPIEDYIHQRRNEIRDECERASQALLPAEERGRRLALVPGMIDRIAERALVIERAIESGQAEQLAGVAGPALEADARLDLGLDPAQIVAVYTILRRSIAQQLERRGDDAELVHAVRALDQAIDEALASAVGRHAEAVREAAQQAAARLQFLDDASVALSSSIDYDRTLQRVARLAVPVLADWCLVDLVEPAGMVRRVSVAYRNPWMARVACEWAARYPADAGTSRGVAQVIRTGEPELACEIPDGPRPADAYDATDPDAEHRRALRGLGLQSYLIVPLTARGRTLGAITLVMTTTGRCYGAEDVALATELARRAALAVDNARLYHDAEEAIRAREQLLGIVSHDLRNPLGAMGIVVSMLRDAASERDEPTSEQLDIIGRSIDRMTDLISDLIDTSAIQGRRMTLDRHPVGAASLVDDALETLSVKASGKSIEIRREVATGVRVYGDPGRLTQVLHNLVDNAIKFCRSGDTIAVRVWRNGERAQFVVADSGPGIAEAELPHVFEPYWSAARNPRQSAGLGLYISKGIVEAHGGRIWTESGPGKGTSQFFTLPLATEPRPA